MLDRAQTAAQVTALRAAGGDGLTIVVSPSERLDASVVADYAALGVDHLAVVPPARFWRPGAEVADFEDFVRANAPA